ncbi:MAG: TonB-dependent receptor [Salinivirgaceae bacterium]|nr:TonB-dependent receptor [Salinivirgaceae bacterium]
MKRLLFCATLLLAMTCQLFAQTKDVSSMTKDDIMKLSYDELLEMPFEDVLHLADVMGVSMDELFAMIMNKSVSSASKKAEDSFKSPLSSTVITKAEIRSYGISSIEEALRLVPGMIVQEKTNGMYDVHIRGLNNIPDNQMMLYTENSNILLMIDGRIAHNYATGNLNFDILPIGIEDIERIEVVRGANSALYGPNAVTGVINIITEKPGENSKTLQGSMMMGTHENYVGDVAFRKNINKKLSVGVTANLQYRRRSTNQLYVYPNHGLYYSKMNEGEKSETKDGMSQGRMAYFMGMVDDKGQPYNQPIVNPDGSVTLVPDLSKAKLFDASQGGYYDMTDIKNLKQAFTFGAIAGQVPDALKAQILEIQKGKYEQSPDAFLHNYGSEPSEATVEAFLNGLANNLPYSLYDVTEKQGNMDDMFDDPGMSRKTYGFNSYVNYRPTEDMNFDLSFGYQQSRAGATPIGEIPFLLCERVSKTGYFTLNSNIYGLSLNASYMGGIQDFQKGKPGFKVFVNNVQVNAEYDIKLGDLSVMPGVAYNHVWQTDYIPDYINPNDPTDFRWEYHDHGYKFTNARHLSSCQGGKEAKLTDIAPSLRLDYRLGDLRVLGAVRFDKTNLPDKWDVTYQAAANYSINENNLVRASFGTARRSANLTNAVADYTWHRDGMMPPDTIYFQGDKDAPLTKIKSAELGYRWRPTEKILVDAEAYYSLSEDFGALKAYRSQVIMPYEKLDKFMSNPYVLKSLRSITEGDLDLDALNEFMKNTSVISTIKYDALPYKVKQMGFGVNIDWIISKKLIAKVNANIQQTKIDNYYAYNQNTEILGQLGQIFGMITQVPAMAEDMQTAAINELMASGTFTEQQLMKVLGVEVDENGNQTPIPVDFESADFKTYFGMYEKYLHRAMGDIDQSMVADIAARYAAADDKQAFLDELKNSNNDTEYTAYYAIRYGVYNDNGTFTFGNSNPYELPTVDGHKHKATPSFYGMIGLIYKPTPKIDVTAYGNYLGKRTYATKYNMGDNAVELKDRFTLSMKIAYKPVPGMEVFLNGHNMLNNEQREFPYGDKIGGIYSVGINFGF